MKTRKLLIAILVVALLAVYYILGTDYLKQRRDHEALASQITVAKEVLAQIPPRPADLETRLSDAQTGLEEAKNTFPERLNSTRIIDAILRLADDIGVKAIPLVTQPWTMESVEGGNYSILRLHVAVTGTFNQMSDFLSQLENGDIETLVMEYLTVDSITAPFGGEDAYGDTLQVDTRLEIAVYSQPPAIELKEEGLLE
ncbi:MAG: hypothetical protein KAS25_01550 [Dehalococcoidales bacterium]|nr:hypothetical protein [Dehalococcoidales bacterium]